MRQLRSLYLVNAALLATHEIDSAYWREWEMFGVPAGGPLFVALNLVLLVLVLHGLVEIATESPRAIGYSWMMVGFGFVATALNTYFLASGSPQFREPVSLAIIYALFLASFVQALATVRLSVRGVAL